MKTTWYDLVSKIAKVILDVSAVPPALADQISRNIGIIEHSSECADETDGKKLSGAQKKKIVVDAVVEGDYPGIDQRLLEAIIDAAVDAANNAFKLVGAAEKAIETREPDNKRDAWGGAISVANSHANKRTGAPDEYNHWPTGSQHVDNKVTGSVTGRLQGDPKDAKDNDDFQNDSRADTRDIPFSQAPDRGNKDTYPTKPVIDPHKPLPATFQGQEPVNEVPGPVNENRPLPATFAAKKSAGEDCSEE